MITVPRGDHATVWNLDPDAGIGISRAGQRVELRPFMGIMGMPLDQPGIQSTFPPTRCGGNLDCRELTEGTALFLPIAVDGALFSTGDGHAVQGDGEVAGPALNCPMEVEMEFQLHPELRLSLPRARLASSGWLTFGFSRTLDEAAAIATVEMVKLMGELYGFSPRQALSLASLVVDLRIRKLSMGSVACMPCCAATLSNRRWSRRHESGFLQSCSLSQGGEHSTPRRTGSSSRMGQRDVRAKSEAGERHHCTLMCASVITFPHSFNSSEKNCAVSSGLVAPGSSWSSCNLSLTFGSLRISTVSRLILAASGTGVRGGATSANQVMERKPGRLASSIVGISGSAVIRFVLPTARIFS